MAPDLGEALAQVAFDPFDSLVYRIATCEVFRGSMGPADVRALSFREFARALAVAEVYYAKVKDDQAKSDSQRNQPAHVRPAVTRPAYGGRR